MNGGVFLQEEEEDEDEEEENCILRWEAAQRLRARSCVSETANGRD